MYLTRVGQLKAFTPLPHPTGVANIDPGHRECDARARRCAAPRTARDLTTQFSAALWTAIGQVPGEDRRRPPVLLPTNQEMKMRMMLRLTVPVEKGNAMVNDGSPGTVIEKVMEKAKPEAAYFMPLGGERAGMMFFDMKQPSDIAGIAETLFQGGHASVEFVPVMNAGDLQKALGSLRAWHGSPGGTSAARAPVPSNLTGIPRD
jgi:hypothetical protein